MRAIDGDILEKKLKDAIDMCMSIDTSGLSELKAVLEDVEEMPTIDPEPHWIPCSEKLPEANGRYLVTRGLVAAGALWNRVYIANYSNLMGIKSVKIWWQGNVGKSDFERLDDVLAWMPLPEPYRKENR